MPNIPQPPDSAPTESARTQSANCAEETRILNDPNYQQDRVKHATEIHKGCGEPKSCACKYHKYDDLGDPIPVDTFWELIRSND